MKGVDFLKLQSGKERIVFEMSREEAVLGLFGFIANSLACGICFATAITTILEVMKGVN